MPLPQSSSRIFFNVFSHCLLALGAEKRLVNSVTSTNAKGFKDTLPREDSGTYISIRRHKTCPEKAGQIRAHAHHVLATSPNRPIFILSGLFWLRSCVVSVLNAVRSVTTLRGLSSREIFLRPAGLCSLLYAASTMSLPFHYRLLMSGFQFDFFLRFLDSPFSLFARVQSRLVGWVCE